MDSEYQKAVEEIPWGSLSSEELAKLKTDPKVPLSAILQEEARRDKKTFGGKPVILTPNVQLKAETLIHKGTLTIPQTAAVQMANTPKPEAKV